MSAKQMNRASLKRRLSRLLSVLLLFHLLICGVNAGSIVGETTFIDALHLAPLKVSKDQDYCGETLPNQSSMVDSNGNLRNVVVFLEDVVAGVAVDTQKLNQLENNGCLYTPRVLAMRRGERLQIRNADPKLHIPHSYLQEKTVFMLSLPFRNSVLEATSKIREAGILKLVCDTHAWMIGFVHVFDHPYFAVSDQRGSFSIMNVPAGVYRITAWHEDAGIMSQEVTVPEIGEVRKTFEFSRK
jgi:hypothetical protein